MHSVDQLKIKANTTSPNLFCPTSHAHYFRVLPNSVIFICLLLSVIFCHIPSYILLCPPQFIPAFHYQFLSTLLPSIPFVFPCLLSSRVFCAFLAKTSLVFSLLRMFCSCHTISLRPSPPPVCHPFQLLHMTTKCANHGLSVHMQ